MSHMLVLQVWIDSEPTINRRALPASVLRLEAILQHPSSNGTPCAPVRGCCRLRLAVDKERNSEVIPRSPDDRHEL